MGEILALPRIGGHPALDFANTAGWHASPQRLEHLHTYQDVLDWARLAGLIPPRVVADLARRAGRTPRQARLTLAHAVRFRETLFRIFVRVSQRRAPLRKDLDALHHLRLIAMRATRLVPRGRSFTVRWEDRGEDLRRPLYPVAMAAAELLESGPLDRVRQCANHPCGWVFLDRSKSGTRRWCSSEECGNATRVRRFRDSR